MGYNLEITRPNDKKTEKKFRQGKRERPVLLGERNVSCQKRCRKRGGGEVESL